MNSKLKERGSSRAKAHSGDGGSISETMIDMSLVMAGVAGILRTKAIIGADEKIEDNETYEAYFNQYTIETGKLLADEKDAVAAINAYQNWLNASDYVYAEPILFVVKEFEVSLTVNAPSGSITVTMSAEPTVTDDYHKVIKAMKTQLQDDFNKAFGKVKSEAKPQNTEPKQSKETETEEVECDTLRVSEYQGNIVYRVIPTEGRWKRYGIPLYKSDAKRLKLDLPAEIGEYELEGTATYELNDDDKPRRVIDFTYA